jgi:hypothetical protein
VRHVGHHIVNFQLIVHCEANVEAMNRRTRQLGALTGNDEGIGFDIGQGSFNVP